MYFLLSDRFCQAIAVRFVDTQAVRAAHENFCKVSEARVASNNQKSVEGRLILLKGYVVALWTLERVTGIEPATFSLGS